MQRRGLCAPAKSKKEELAEQRADLDVEREMWKLRPTPKTLVRTKAQLVEERQLVLDYAHFVTDRHYKDNAESAQKLKLKLAALNELPPDLRHAALQEDWTPMPKVLPPHWTAPNPNYQSTLSPMEQDQAWLERERAVKAGEKPPSVFEIIDVNAGEKMKKSEMHYRKRTKKEEDEALGALED